MTHSFTYTLKTHPRAKHLSIRITRAGKVIVTKPRRVSLAHIEHVLVKKESWILSKIAHMKSLPPPPAKITKQEYALLKKQAQELAEKKVKHFNEKYNFSFKRITIKNQKTRWGSCSSKGNLNFNYKIALLPEELVDYIVVHELCRLQQMNHAKKFWQLVAQTIPEYQKHHKTLRSKGLQLS